MNKGETPRFLVFAGTVEGRTLAGELAAAGCPVTVSVATEYGEKIVEEQPGLTVHRGRMTAEEMASFMKAMKEDAGNEGGAPCQVVDATHPYAAAVSENIRAACETAHLPYLRLLRESEQADGMEDCVFVASAKEAAEYLKATEGNVLLTTGSKELEVFTEIPDYQARLFPRVLSTAESVLSCAKLGFEGKNLICMQGPFSEELNTAMLKQIHAAWMVTKETGKSGGFGEKLSAARKAGVKVIVIGRPVKEEGYGAREIKQILEEKYALTLREETESSGAGKSEAITVQEKGMSAAAQDKMEITDAYAVTGKDQAAAPNADESIAGKDKVVVVEIEKNAVTGKEKEAEVSDVPQSGKTQVTLAGIGMGSYRNMTVEVVEACREADAILGASRMVEFARTLGKPVYCAYKDDELKAYIDAHPEYRKVVVLLSGDIGFYSGAKKLRQRLSDYPVRMLSGISSVVYFCGKLGTSWEDVKLLSLHGKEDNIVGAVARNQKVFALIGGRDGVNRLCRQFMEYGLSDVKLHVGERLSYLEERITSGTPGQLEGTVFDGLCVVLAENPGAGELPVTHGLPDECFLRDKVPMTKSEVRSISLSKLQLQPDSVIYDVGAGTGSVSIEMALQASEGMVYAIEKNQTAVELIEKNKRVFRTANIQVIEGLAPEAMEALPVPTHAFIGGSSGNLREIMECLLKKNPECRIVINTIALESIAETLDCVKALPVTDVDIAGVSVAKSKTLGRYHMMMGQNPVYIISCRGVK